MGGILDCHSKAKTYKLIRLEISSCNGHFTTTSNSLLFIMGCSKLSITCKEIDIPYNYTIHSFTFRPKGEYCI